MDGKGLSMPMIRVQNGAQDDREERAVQLEPGKCVVLTSLDNNLVLPTEGSQREIMKSKHKFLQQINHCNEGKGKSK